MIQDNSLVFDPSGTAITVTAVSTNVLDLINNRDLGQGMYREHVMTLVGTSFASSTAGATLNVQLQGAPDNGSGSPGGYELIGESGAMPLGLLIAGNKAAQFLIPSVSQQINTVLTTTITTTAASTSATVASATGLLQGMVVNAAGVVPGTTIASISGTTITLSANASANGTAVAAAFTGTVPPYRFLRLNYVCSATMTAGAVTSWLGGDVEENTYYRPGVVVAN